ncbi:hypothetical protein B0H16DRAFT_1695317 [Mycena metata]|uniref:Uncharacterized protein n=1 Tax=Mycena metata TaxID=1033252 RepID=A0AAD7I7B0_9AGAR|nr:hypothetical protein B0H16DRAFT_1695317 [Mycena metata]
MSSQFAIRRQDLAAATAPLEVPFLAMPLDLSGPWIFGLIDRKCQLYRRRIIDLPLVALNKQNWQILRVAQLLAYHHFSWLCMPTGRLDGLDQWNTLGALQLLWLASNDLQEDPLKCG